MIVAAFHSTLHSLYSFSNWIELIECVPLVENEKIRNPWSDVVG